jgi:glycosyltransferase involved in cell wall biosynthesis
MDPGKHWQPLARPMGSQGGGLSMNDRNPKVTVCVVTYNQESYIAQCLQSLVEQQTDFDFEVIVGDDGSSDGTVAVVQQFAARYPGIVRTVLHPENIGPTRNYLSVHDIARGIYTAHLDGDDYALPGKLQAQADYLDAHPGCAVVWHRMEVFDDAGTFCVPNLPDVAMFDDGKVCMSDLLAFGSIGYHSSIMYRASARPPHVFDGEVLDFKYAVEFLMSGYAKYLEPVFGGYRLNVHTGISREGNGVRVVRRRYIGHLTGFLQQFPEARRQIFFNSTINLLYDLKARRPTAHLFLALALKSFCLMRPRDFVDYFKKFRRLNPRLTG